MRFLIVSADGLDLESLMKRGAFRNTTQKTGLICLEFLINEMLNLGGASVITQVKLALNWDSTHSHVAHVRTECTQESKPRHLSSYSSYCCM